MSQEWFPPAPALATGPEQLDVDVCVIGSGTGGAVFASELAEAGWRVALLEKGPYVGRQDFNQQERDMLPLLYEDAGLRTTEDGAIQILQGRCVGGSSTVNWAICFDPPELVMAEWGRRLGPVGLDAAGLAPSLAKVRRLLNVQALREDELTPNGRVFMEGARRVGFQAERFEHNRTECLRSGFCMLGCAYDRKQTMNVTYVPRARHFGAELRPDAEVTGFRLEGARVVAALARRRNPHSGAVHELTVRAKLFALAGGAISTPMLLQRAGLASPWGPVGRGLRLHPTTAAVGVFPQELRGGEGIHYGAHVRDLEGEGILLESVFAFPGLMAASTGLWGGEARALLAKYHHLAAAIVLLKDQGSGRVRPGPGGRPLIEYALAPQDPARLRRGLRALASIFFAAGATEVVMPVLGGLRLRGPGELHRLDGVAFAPNEVALFSAHQMGTVAMGPAESGAWVDAYGRSHGHPNLWVVDASVFPTALGVNPQITIATLADRSARRVLSLGPEAWR